MATRVCGGKQGGPHSGRKEYVRDETYTSCAETLQASIQNNDSDERHSTSVGCRRLEHFLLSKFCAVDPTPLRLCMLATPFHPNEFGGRFFSVHSNAHHTIL